MATNLPIGGIDEIKALGLKPKKVAACADPENPLNGKGCPFAEICDEPCKGLPGRVKWTDKDGNPCSWEAEGAVRHGPGPITQGVRLYKPVIGSPDDFIVVDTTFDCFHFFHQRAQMEANGGMAEVIAREGETIMVAGSVKRIIPGEGGQPPQVVWDDQQVPLKIKPFVRPMERKEYRNRALNAQRVDEGSNERRRERIDKFRRAHGSGDGDSPKPGGRGATRG